ncbi:MAG TPA: BamA/TamA family outer membrane protein [Longimicrobiales bacterium]
MFAALAVVLAVQVDVTVDARVLEAPAAVVQDTIRPVPDSAMLASAYLDPVARELVARARWRREHVESSIRDYRALVRERLSAGIRALHRERLLFRREAAARIHYRRNRASEVEVLGARDVMPIVSARAQAPDDLEDYARHLVYDPAGDQMLAGLEDLDYFRHPLAAGSEVDYRFATGDTTTLRLPDGRTVRLFGLRVLPRRSDSRLVSGVLWLEEETHGVVQAVFRLARAYDLERDADPEDADDVDEIPGLLKPIRADFRYVTIEYALWEMRWWLPRLIAFEGYAQAGAFLRVPIRYERLYSEYRVEGDTLGLPLADVELARNPFERRCYGEGCHCEDGRCRRIRVHVPADTAALLTHPLLPPSAFEEGEVLLTGTDVEEITAVLAQLPGPPATWQRPRVYWGFSRPGLVRYNRVEGLSLGVRAETRRGRLAADLTARLGTADLEPNAELGLEGETGERRFRVAAYRRLTPVVPESNPFGLGNSLDALLLAHDQGDYFRAAGLEVAIRPPLSRPATYTWRVYAEHQSPTAAWTDFSLRGALDEDVSFRPNLEADRADQIGTELTLRLDRGLDPDGFRGGAELSLEAATGTFRFGRAALVLRGAAPLPGPFVLATEGAAGTIFGRPPVQALWFIGGPASVRGYEPLADSGTAFWRGRAEVATAVPAARIALFSDIGWAGARQEIDAHDALASAGIGVSLLDGLLRFDLARALRRSTAWRIHLYVDAAL